jgi:PhoPQ-activated pathogenicity-related protein
MVSLLLVALANSPTLAYARLVNPLRERPPQEFYRFLRAKDSSYSHRVVTQTPDGMDIQLMSQTWRGIPWKHQILFHQPKQLSTKGTAILYVTGDGPKAGDYRDIGLVSVATGMPVAMLFGIPNQPIWGKREDELIAYTFNEFLSTGDATWPLLFPMAKSAERAMDAVVESTKGSRNPITKFVVTGASKRGWTTWFVGAAKDKRVIAIAPMVYDNLNAAPQMKHQIESWGQYSEQIQDYTRLGIQQKLSTPMGQRLAQIVDPFSYRQNIRVPTLIVRGANDPYWTADATSLYWDRLKQPHWLCTVPNVGHDLGGGVQAALTVGAFARSVSGEFEMPQPDGTIHVSADELSWTAPGSIRGTRDLKLTEIGLWIAESENLDFRKSKYRREAVLKVDGSLSGTLLTGRTVRPKANVAAFLEFRYEIHGRGFQLDLPTEVIPSNLPAK